jgi:hypothetical protein
LLDSGAAWICTAGGTAAQSAALERPSALKTTPVAQLPGSQTALTLVDLRCISTTEQLLQLSVLKLRVISQTSGLR